MPLEKSKHLTPSMHRRLGPVEWPVPVPDAVTGTVVAVELVGFAVLLEFGLVLVHLLGAGGAVVVTENADQRAREILGQVDRRNRRLGTQLILAHHDAPTPQLGAGVDV